jgi:hypothetical protein
MAFLNGTNENNPLANALFGSATPVDQLLSNQTPAPSAYNPVLTSSQTFTGLPSNQVPSELAGVAGRDIVNWFVPEIGIINMYINPQNIGYNHKKLITTHRTKGGYIGQYWGEDLTHLTLRGHTGSSGVEGLNVLYEIYRAEQYLFDPIALQMAAANSISGLNSFVDSTLGNLSGFANNIASATAGIFQFDPASQAILPQNIPSLASIAFGVEMYYAGWVFRGFFESFNFTESAERIGLFDYDIAFTVTQRRGYRINNQPWQHSPLYGPSNWNTNPLTFATLANATTSTPIGSGNNGSPFGV